jgi:chromosome partitioning protein
VLNAVLPRSTLADEAAATLADAGAAVAPVRLGHRADFINPLSAGQVAIEWAPRGKAARRGSCVVDVVA